MAPMRPRRRRRGLACLLAAGALVAGCGGGSTSSSQVNPQAATGKSRPAPPKSAFPTAEGKTLQKCSNLPKAAHHLGRVTPAAKVFYPGQNRYPFRCRKVGSLGEDGPASPTPKSRSTSPRSRPETRGEIEIGAARGCRKRRPRRSSSPAIGPFPARIETLATKPAFRAKTTTEDPDVATVVYATELDFPSDGE